MTEGAGKVVGIDRLHDVSVRAALERRLDQFRILRDGENRDLHVGEFLADLGEAREPVHLGHAQVEQDEIGLEPANERQYLHAVDRLADDLEVAGALKCLFRSLDHQPMVIRNQDSQDLLLPQRAGALSLRR